MESNVRAALKARFRSEGEELLDDPKRLKALLKDLCPGQEKEIFLVTLALEAKVPQEILKERDAPFLPTTLGRLEKDLMNQRGLADEGARFAVESWAFALDVPITPRTLPPPPPPPPASAVPPPPPPTSTYVPSNTLPPPPPPSRPFTPSPAYSMPTPAYPATAYPAPAPPSVPPPATPRLVDPEQRTLREIPCPGGAPAAVRVSVLDWLARNGFEIVEMSASGVELRRKVGMTDSVRLHPVPGNLVALSRGLNGPVIFELAFVPTAFGTVVRVEGYCVVYGLGVAKREFCLSPTLLAMMGVPRKRGWELLTDLEGYLRRLAAPGWGGGGVPPSSSAPPTRRF